ncbi:unnamed protein product, partial [Mesorhabditis spiculigera]
MILILLTLGLAYYVISYYAWVRKFPKGPKPLPLIGNLHQLNPRQLYMQFRKWSKVYGDVFTVFTPRPFVIITNYEGIKEAFATKGEEFAGRMGTFPNTVFMQSGNNGGILFSQGDRWKEARRQSIHILRDFGMGKNLMEEQVKVCLTDLLDHIEAEHLNKETSMRWPLQIFVSNVINKTLYNFSYSFNDCDRLLEFADNLQTLIETMKTNRATYMITNFPWMSKIPFFGWYGQGWFMNVSKALKRIVSEDVANALKDYDVKDEPSCFVQAFHQRTMNTPSIADQTTDVAMDFFIAGSETTTTTLRWGLCYLADNLDVQEKVRAEIHSVIGRERIPNFADRTQMPYTQAAIMEIQRMASILPLNLVHRTVCETSVQGLSIPENVLVWGQIDGVLYMDPNFKNPETFDPTRFLLEDGKTFNKTTVERMVAFCIGKRQCAGEGLARMELFLVLAALFQRFKIEPSPGWKIDLTGIPGTVRLPSENHYKVTKV